MAVGSRAASEGGPHTGSDSASPAPSETDRRCALLFVLFVIILSWAPPLVVGLLADRVVLSSEEIGGSSLFWVLAAAPTAAWGLAALLARDPKPWRFRWNLPARWILIPFLLALAWIAGIVFLGAQTRLSEWPIRGTTIPAAVASSLLHVLRVGLPLALLQEIGWRGALLPRLLRYGRIEASLVTGIVWAISSAPLLLMTPLFAGAPEAVRYAAFGVHIVILSMIMTWIYCGSGRSLWVSILSHALLWTFAARITGPSVLDGMPILVGAHGILGSMFLVLWTWWLYVRGAFRGGNAIRANPRAADCTDSRPNT